MNLSFDRRQRLALGACGAAQLLVVALVAASQPTSGTPAIVVALVLAPVAVAGVFAGASRFGGSTFSLAAAAVYVLLPFLGNRFQLPPARSAFDSRALPALVGLQKTGLFVVGVAVIWAVAVLPERVAAILGVAALAVALVAWSPSALGDVKPMLHETAWSVALPQWLVVATIVGALFRRPWLGAALGGFAIATILRASHQPLADAGFWRALGPLVPAGGVLLSVLVFLVPRLRTTDARQRQPAS